MLSIFDDISTMSESSSGHGRIDWVDLTIEDAEGIRDFYEKVVGWSSSPVDMGGYRDYTMLASDQSTVAGVCHARGENADLPSQWLIYITVADLDQSIVQCEQLGGEVLSGPRQVGHGRCAVIRDPAGACVALYQLD